ncbi:DUF7544 domain-containing protein [Streptomyces sp. DT24]|uniref:DUF7544 domain-containing protein n=1 Tax=Streptomyces sp. DT24 TaxID=3416520 RepID=UPI003CEC8403
MNDTPGWVPPGSAPSGDRETGVPRPSEPVDGAGPAGQWSTSQPPPGQWSPPGMPSAGPGVPPPSPGWGGGRPPGPGWNRPPAAKPGVIPLRPLGVGEILDGAVSAMRAHWRTVLGISLTISVIAQTAITLLERYVLPKPRSIDPKATGSEAIRQVAESTSSSLTSSALSTVIVLIATLLTSALLTVVVSRATLGRPVSLSDAWSEARPRLLRLLGLSLLLGVVAAGIMLTAMLPGLLLGSVAGAVLLGLGGLGGLLVTVWLLIRYCLASPALILEKQSIAEAMRRSAKLVRGAWWRTFGILALTYVLTLMVALIVSIPFGIIAVASDGGGIGSVLEGDPQDFGWPFLIIAGIGDVIVSTITYPLTAGVMVLLYIDQRIRREALDIDLARAAGLPGYDTLRS